MATFADKVVKDLSRYYDKNHILQYEFACPQYEECLSDSVKERFTTAKPSYIGREYGRTGKKPMPRLVFLSSDPGSQDPNKPEELTFEGLRKGVKKLNYDDRTKTGVPRGRHWDMTYRFAWEVFHALGYSDEDIGRVNSEGEFLNDTEFHKVERFFCHVNTVKCCQNNRGGAEAHKTLYHNCRYYMPKELEILEPHILVTQGDRAYHTVDCYVLGKSIPIAVKKRLSETGKPYDFAILDTPFNKKTVWVIHYHPNQGRGLFKKNKIVYPKYAEEIRKVIRER